ncbi:carbohydrate esterase family 8 protein [Pleomassaria siparia CBS 279.74]|uniref:Pectinesterase n=1 Tax=Pleomassaria siparia CBS 279.74 TaxID=1314801 RepID=A0A6G1KNW5_9PLEO|nr:carbohydrate esterase family 8 protein [Pleomassaria siparia CBS 279.74]
MFFSKLALVTLAFTGISLAVPTSNTLEKRTARTSAPTGCLSVQADTTTSGWYQTVASAVASLSGTADACIFIYSGTYTEQIAIEYGGALTVYGYTTDTGSYKNNAVTITHTISSSAAGSLDASSTLQVKSSNFKMYNINVANGYGSSAQAVALTANGDQQGYYGCKFDGYQDTLYAKSGYQYYSNCYIAGATDYIFGDASAWFGGCTIASKAGGAITASSREVATDTSWFVIDDSTVTADTGVSLSQNVYLGRPWRVLARVIYQNSVLTGVVAPEGYTTMATDATPIYMEYNNSGDGADTSERVDFTATDSAVSKDTLWPAGYAWIDTSY